MLIRTIAVYGISAVLAYLLGSVNSAIIVTKLFYRKDVREYGSGNAGMTNVLRNFGTLPAALTFIGDFGKGIMAVIAARLFFRNIIAMNIMFISDTTKYPPISIYTVSYAAAFFVLLGHIFPVFYGFKGGKGILTTAGVILVLDYKIFIILLLVFLSAVLISKIVSLSSIIASAAFPVFTFITSDNSTYTSPSTISHTILAAAISAIIIFMHRENIKRLIAGTEHKFGRKKED